MTPMTEEKLAEIERDIYKHSLAKMTGNVFRLIDTLRASWQAHARDAARDAALIYAAERDRNKYDAHLNLVARALTAAGMMPVDDLTPVVEQLAAQRDNAIALLDASLNSCTLEQFELLGERSQKLRERAERAEAELYCVRDKLLITEAKLDLARKVVEAARAYRNGVEAQDMDCTLPSSIAKLPGSYWDLLRKLDEALAGEIWEERVHKALAGDGGSGT